MAGVELPEFLGKATANGEVPAVAAKQEHRATEARQAQAERAQASKPARG
jgi:hypothetical protein